MADPKTQFLTNDPLTRKKWARELFKVLLPAVEFNELIGTDSEAIVQQKTELAKGEGDVIKFGIRLPLIGDGVVGNDTVEGNEEKMRFRNFSCTIEELNHAVDTGGKMEEQRVPYDLMMEGKNGLQDWWADKLSNYMFANLCSDTSFKIAGKTFANTIVAPSTATHAMVNSIAEASMTGADMADLDFLDKMKQMAEVPTGANNFKKRPTKMAGKNYFRVIVHNYVYDQIRKNLNAGQWGDMQRAAGKLGVPNTEFEYNGMLISKSERIRLAPGTTNVYRNILLGAQAAVLAWGGAGDSKSTTMSFHPYTRDADRFMLVRGGGILGIKKVQFGDEDGTSNMVDYGIITGSSYASAISA